MKKNKIKLYSGFTIGELLISMLIVMLVAAAMVPIIGPKRIKVPMLSRQNHGIFECYYDSNGNLMQYYANNADRKNADPEAVATDHCEFTPPDADSVEVFAIGPGGAGLKSDDDLKNVYYNLNYDETLNGKIELPNSRNNTAEHYFLSNINSASRSIRDASKYDAGPGSNSYRIQDTTLREMFHDWREERIKDEKDLYIKFTSIVSPSGLGGKGLAMRVSSAQYTNNPTESCVYRLSQNPNDEKLQYGAGKHLKSSFTTKGVNGIIIKRTNDYSLAAAKDNKCYWYVNAAGSDAFAGYKIKTPLYVPFDSNGGFYVQQLPYTSDEDRGKVTIYSSADNKDMEVGLLGQPGGNDAYYDKSIHALVDGEKPNSTNGGTISNSPSGIKVGSTNGYMNTLQSCAIINSDCPEWQVKQSDCVNKGAKFGDETSIAGGTLEPTPESCNPTSGELSYEQYPFSWIYYRLKAYCSYIKAGVPGEVKYIAYNNLKSKLYLYPGKRGQNGVSNTIISINSNINNGNKPILIANAGTNGVTESRSDILLNSKNSTFPRPPQDIMDAAIADNTNVFDTYIAKINASGFKKGLYHCDRNNGSCPGYAGQGAYPVIEFGNVNYNNQSKKIGLDFVKLIDNQNVNGSFTRAFESTATPSHSSCDYGPSEYNNSINNPLKYTGIDGKTYNYNVKYCLGKSKSDIRRDGAVIIIW